MYLEKDPSSSQVSSTPPSSGENIAEKPSVISEEFLMLRKNINAQALKSLEERFPKAELERLRAFTEDDEKAFREHYRLSWKREPTVEEIEDERKEHSGKVDSQIGSRVRALGPNQAPEPGDIVLEPGKVLQPGLVTYKELLDQMEESGVKPERNQSIPEAEVFDVTLPCEGEKCLKLSEQIERYYKGYGDNEPINASGDYFRIKRQKTDTGAIRTDLLLSDAQGHGAEAKPLSLLVASFLRNIENEESREMIVALDAYLASLRVQKKEVSLVRATLEEEENAPNKKLSFMRAGEAFAFWVEGDKDSGYAVRIISDKSIKGGESVHIVFPTENSATGPLGDGTTEGVEIINGPLEPQTFDLPRDVAVFLASDGIFDMRNRQTGEDVKHGFSEICRQIMKDTKGMERAEIEHRLFEELRRIANEYEQTDDITLIKLAA